MTLDEHRAELKERCDVFLREIGNVNYNYNNMTAADLAMWSEAKIVQIGIILEQPVTAETNKRLDEILTEAHGMMFFDAIALGGKE